MMKIVNLMDVIGRTKGDDKRILQYHSSGNTMFIDDEGRIYSEDWKYIADGLIVDSGTGLGNDNCIYINMRARQREMKIKRTEI